MASISSKARPTPGDEEQHLPLRTLRRYTEGTLAFDDRRLNVRFVLDRASARVIMPVEAAALKASQHVLFLPSEDKPILQLLILPEPLDRPEAHEGPDRWLAYHPSFAVNRAGAWMAGSIEAGKTETTIFNAEELCIGNTLRDCEHRLVKSVNNDRAKLAAACTKLLSVDVADPLCVGVDPLGLDVRARFGVLRLEFAQHSPSAAEAEASIATLFGSGLAGKPKSH